MALFFDQVVDIKKSQQYAPTITYPYAQYSPTHAQQYAFDYTAPQIQIASPYASQETKKEQTLSQETVPTITQSPSTSPQLAQTSASTDNTMIWVLVIAGIGLGAFYLYSKSKK